MPGSARGFLLAAALLAACGNPERRENQAPPRRVVAEAPVSAPKLINRDDVIRYRDAAARELLASGDSLTIKVYVRVDTAGMVHQPEVKDEVADQRLAGAAISVTQMMHFAPAEQDGKAVSVLLTIPVRFVNKGE